MHYEKDDGADRRYRFCPDVNHGRRRCPVLFELVNNIRAHSRTLPAREYKYLSFYAHFRKLMPFLITTPIFGSMLPRNDMGREVTSASPSARPRETIYALSVVTASPYADIFPQVGYAQFFSELVHPCGVQFPSKV